MRRGSPFLAALVGAWLAQSALADTFTYAGNGAVDYTATPHAAKMRCKDLIATGDYAFTIIGAREIAGSGGVPAHCRIDGAVPSEVRFEVNLPLDWNGRLYMFGNGGLAGTPAIDPGKQASRDQALARGFATAYTDTGHDKRVETGGTFAHNNFHKLVDYGFRAVHLTVTSAKTIAEHFYGQGPDKSYWQGCSTGGRQAMISAQRFPQDFDGIIAGAPAADYSGLKFSQAWRVAAINRSGLSEPEVLELARHIYASCDARDGAEDGLIADPRRCDFDVDRDLPHCDGADTDACFDDAERAALRTYYAPVTIGDEIVYPAMPVGSEVAGPQQGTMHTGWVPWLINPTGGPVLLDLLGSDFFRYMAFVEDRPEYDWTEYDFATPPDNLAEFRAIVDAIDPDLSAFRARGGKLISYFGWADPDINPLTLISYNEAVRRGDEGVDDYFRVFLIPGMFHCRGGPGHDRFDAMTPLIDWVEADTAPAQMETWRVDEAGNRLDSRPSCAYPLEARPSGDNFECAQAD